MDQEPFDDQQPFPESGSTLADEILSPGEKFGNFQVMKCLNFGLFGGLYMMEHIRDLNEVCVAVLPKLLNDDKSFSTRFIQYAKALENLTHPNILTLIGSEEIKNHYCLIFEAIEGEMLNDYLDRYAQEQLVSSGQITGKERLSLKVQEELSLKDQAFGLKYSEVKSLIRQTSEALRKAHETGFHHFNLNPTAIIRDSKGNVKVYGFGLLELIGTETFEQLVSIGIPPVQMGNKRVLVNTIDSLSPEVRNGKKANARSDIYALGYTGYYLLTGKRPTAQGKPPSDFSPAISLEMDSLILKALEPDPEKRLPTVRNFLAELAKIDQESRPTKKSDRRISKSIEKIPLPKPVESKLSKKSQNLVRISVLIVFGLMVLGLGALSAFVLYKDPEPINKAIVKRTKPGRSATVAINVEPPKARVIFKTDPIVSFIINDGTLNLTMPENIYEAQFEASGYVSKSIEFSTGAQTFELNTSLEKAWAKISFLAPPGTEVMAVPKVGVQEIVELGRVPAKGKLQIEERILAGTYDFILTKERHQPFMLNNKKIPYGELISIKADLQPEPGTVNILTVPSGITILQNGKDVGVTPLQISNLTVDLPMKFSTSDERFKQKEVSFSLEAGEVKEINFGELTRLIGSLELEIKMGANAADYTDKAEIEVLIDKDTLDASFDVIEKIGTGQHLLTISHENFLPWQETIEILEDLTTKQLVELKPRPGQLFIVGQSLPEFQLVINNRLIRLNEENKYTLPAEKPLELEVRAKNYLTIKRKHEFKANESFSWAIDLSPIPGPELNENYTIPYLGMDLVWIESGTFTMGSPVTEQSRLPTEGPHTRINLSRGFWAGQYEVTQIQYFQITKENPSQYIGNNHPVDTLTWNNAVSYCQALTKREREANRLPEGYIYRLPTEAEWEYLCRAGTATPFHFGEEASGLNGNFKGTYPRDFEEATKKDARAYGTVEVGSFEANAFMLYDMHGNVSEWCSDYFNSRLAGGVKTDWSGPSSGDFRVIKGGSWEDFAHLCRSAARDRKSEETKSDAQGMRIILATETKPMQ